MRKNTARHWLHASLDLLPVILIPVFMIYSHRHVMTEQTTVDIQYKYQSNEVNSLDDLVEGNIYYLPYLDLDTDNLDGNTYYLQIIKNGEIDSFLYDDMTIDEVILYEYDSKYNNYLTINFDNLGFSISCTNADEYIAVYIDQPCSLKINDLIFIYNNDLYNFFDINQITIYQSSYNEIESVDVHDTNSSIMNVFMDDFNYSVSTYFNMGNVFNLKDVYHWFEVNIFNNNPPLVMASIYNIIVYEFVMDLLFLLYGLFMWFVDMLKRLIEKPIDSIK